MQARDPRLFACDACDPEGEDDYGPAVVYVEVEEMTGQAIERDGLYVCLFHLREVNQIAEGAVRSYSDDPLVEGQAFVSFAAAIETDAAPETWELVDRDQAERIRRLRRPCVDAACPHCHGRTNRNV